jgi:hypothetical protein
MRRALLKICEKALADLSHPKAVQAAFRYDAAKDPFERALWAGMKQLPFCDWPQYLQRHEAAENALRRQHILSESSRRANQTRHEESEAEKTVWQREANVLWQRRPHLTKTAVATQIKQKLDLSASLRTIRGHLQKPGGAR